MPRKAKLSDHLTLEALESGYRGAREAQEARRWRLILLIAQGRTIKEASEIADVNYAHAQDILKRYNAKGIEALQDGRKKPRERGPARHALLNLTQRSSLAQALEGPAPDGGNWTGPKVARWIERKTGREQVGNQRGWDYLRRLGNPVRRKTYRTSVRMREPMASAAMDRAPSS